MPQLPLDREFAYTGKCDADDWESTRMPARQGSETDAGPARSAAGRGYGLLATGWLLLLACGSLAGWAVSAVGPVDRPLASAPLHTGSLPEAPAAPPRALGAAIDPRLHQLAARGSPGSGPPQAGARAADRTDAVDRDATQTPDAPAAVPAQSAAAPAGGSDGPARVHVAARGHASATPTTAAAPLPPPVPRPSVGTVRRVPAEDALGRYSVQVGAFRVRANALARAARLSEAGYDVRIVHAFATRSRLYMVRLGAFDARPAAMAYARRLARDADVATWPVRN
jgi:cell division protein FtsN